MLGDDELEQLRDDAAAALEADAAVIQRLSRTPDGQGGSTRSWATVATVDARLDPAGSAAYPPGREQLLADRDAATAPWIVTMPHDVDVRRTDRIAISGLTLEVIAVPTERNWKITTRALCSEVS